MLDDFFLAADNAINVEYGFNGIRPNGLIYSEYRVLKCLEREETLKTVSAKRKISQQATGKAVRGLVSKGFAENTQYPKGTENIDRREACISRTPSGIMALDYADAVIDAVINEVAAGF
jgi:DNA-binding MarR family transcriptional regulator